MWRQQMMSADGAPSWWDPAASEAPEYAIAAAIAAEAESSDDDEFFNSMLHGDKNHPPQQINDACTALDLAPAIPRPVPLPRAARPTGSPRPMR